MGNAAAGFMLSNDLLIIIAGAGSGAILASCAGYEPLIH